MSKVIDFSSRTKAEVLYSQLQHKMDTRAEGAQDPDFVTKELIPSYKNADEALGALLKFPIEVTGDYVIIVGRNAALALRILLGEDDPKIPVEVYDDIPSFEKLDADTRELVVRPYAVSKDILKTRQRGLKEADLLWNVQHLVDEGYTKDEVAKAMPMLARWRVDKLYAKAKGIWTQKALASARAEKKALEAAKKPVNAARIIERVGLPAKYIKDLTDPTRRGARSAAFNALKSKQKLSPNSKKWADSNFLWYTLSATGQLATSDFPNKTLLSSKAFLEITQHHLNEAQALVSLWTGALMRANTQVSRIEHGNSVLSVPAPAPAAKGNAKAATAGK